MYIRDFSSALVAQLDRATGYEPVGRAFESLQARHKFQGLMIFISPFFVPANGYDLFEHDFFCRFFGSCLFLYELSSKMRMRMLKQNGRSIAEMQAV